MTIADHLLGPAPTDLPPGPVDPFGADDVLAEADLQKVLWDVAAGTCWLLLDLKGALFFPEANTAVVAAGGVRSLTWTGAASHAPGSWGTFMVMGSSAKDDGEELHLGLSGFGSGTLWLSAAVVELWTGDVPGADDAPPDYTTEDARTIRAGLTDWSSEFHPLSRLVRRAR